MKQCAYTDESHQIQVLLLGVVAGIDSSAIRDGGVQCPAQWLQRMPSRMDLWVQLSSDRCENRPKDGFVATGRTAMHDRMRMGLLFVNVCSKCANDLWIAQDVQDTSVAIAHEAQAFQLVCSLYEPWAIAFGWNTCLGPCSIALDNPVRYFVVWSSRDAKTMQFVHLW